MFRTLSVAGAQVQYDQRGAGPHLLLIHSLLTELTVFDRVLPALAATRRVTRINLPGFGASAPRELASIADHAAHLARVMDALGLPRDSAVFANGFGAFVALELAIGHGERFGRLIVADTLAAFPRVRACGMAAVFDTAIARLFPPAFAARHPDVIAERKAALAAVDAQCFARACLALAALDLGQAAPKIANPTLVLCGELDQTTPPALARELASLIPGARYEDIAAAGHCPMLEQPAALSEKMQRFLEP